MGNNPRLRANSSMDFEEFTDKLYVLLKASWGKDWGVFTNAHPTTTNIDNIKFPQIVYNLTSLTPGTFGKTNTIERNYRIREQITTENDEVLEVYGQAFDLEVSFHIYADNNKSATEISKNFREFIFESTSYLKKKGLSQIFFNKEYYSNDKSQETYSVRCLEYYVRLEEVLALNQDLLKKINIKADTIFDEEFKNRNLPSQNNRI